MWFLEHFKKDEIQVINENAEFLSVRDYMTNELNKLETHQAEFVSPDQLEQDLENTIVRYES